MNSLLVIVILLGVLNQITLKNLNISIRITVLIKLNTLVFLNQLE